MRNLIGLKFGKLLVIERVPGKCAHNGIKWKCLCDCGNNTEVASCDLRSGHTQSCGCLQKERASKSLTEIKKRNSNYGITKTQTYRSWNRMMHRCYDPQAFAYELYGGRGIYVCERWHEYKNFLADMGEAPKNYTLDKIDNDKPYYPENCRWATRLTQANNRRTCRYLYVNNSKYSASEFSRFFNIQYSIVLHLFHKGLSGEDILNHFHVSVKTMYLFD